MYLIQETFKNLTEAVHRRWRRGGGGGGGGRGSCPPHFYGTLFARKDRNTLIEQSGSGYSNRAVIVFREAV